MGSKMVMMSSSSSCSCSCRVPWVVICCLLIQASLLILPRPVLSSDDDENTLLQGLNSYRSSLKLPPLTKNKQAGCLADELAEEVKDHPCVATTAANAIQSGTGSPFVNYPKLLKKCDIDPNKTTDGIILPVCVKKLIPTLVLTNYTRTGYGRYINDSRFTGAGLGSEDDWMVAILTTSTPGGSFASSGVGVSCMFVGHVIGLLLLGLVLV